MGDFNKIEIVSEGNLGPRDATGKKPELLQKLEALGEEIGDR